MGGVLSVWCNRGLSAPGFSAFPEIIMATVRVTMGQVAGHSVFVSGTTRSEDIVSGATSARGSLLGSLSDIAQVYCDTAVYASTLATAAPATSLFVPAGTAAYIRLQPGERIAVIDA